MKYMILRFRYHNNMQETGMTANSIEEANHLIDSLAKVEKAAVTSSIFGVWFRSDPFYFTYIPIGES